MKSSFVDGIFFSGYSSDQTKINILLRAMVEVILGINLKDTHALRTGRGANCPQVIDGSRKAYRKNIDREFRVHYWKIGDIYEFANIAHHNDFNISY